MGAENHLFSKPGKEMMLPKQGNGGRRRTDGLAEKLDAEDVRKRGENGRGPLNSGLHIQ